MEWDQQLLDIPADLCSPASDGSIREYSAYHSTLDFPLGAKVFLLTSKLNLFCAISSVLHPPNEQYNYPPDQVRIICQICDQRAVLIRLLFTYFQKFKPFYYHGLYFIQPPMVGNAVANPPPAYGPQHGPPPNRMGPPPGCMGGPRGPPSFSGPPRHPEHRGPIRGQHPSRGRPPMMGPPPKLMRPPFPSNREQNPPGRTNLE
ncbi:unnamed protein product [Nesidiocoris tenuis]|uniref:Uncharacterized protein n=1 Tax=Nesidiocoris tenuis TaxID=355587 RepID=A0A6H5HRG6_9HEMI|nr:unnamed protein product [Nesidiocoris tenuis]